MRKLGFVAVVGWCMLSTLPMQAAMGLCRTTTAGALLAARSGMAPAMLEANRGYRVESVRWDPFLRKAWAVIRSCEHLEQPSFTVPTELPVSGGSVMEARQVALLPIVRPGDLVRLWRRDGYAHIELVATSEENGTVGTRIRLRLAAKPDADGQTGQPQYLAGVVRGPADVEIVP